MKFIGIVLVVFIGMVAIAGCTSEELPAANEPATITIEQVDVVMLANESGEDCFIAGLYRITNVGDTPIADEVVSVDLMDVQTGEKLDSTNISLVYLGPGSSGDYKVRFDHLECTEKYTLTAPLQKGFFRG